MKKALAVLGALAGLLHSGSMVSAQGTDAVYSNHGAFVVQVNFQPGRPIVCYAATHTTARGGAPIDLNIMYNGQEWVISFPYSYGVPAAGGLTIDGRNDAFQSEPLGDGYNGFPMAAALIPDLQNG